MTSRDISEEILNVPDSGSDDSSSDGNHMDNCTGYHSDKEYDHSSKENNDGDDSSSGDDKNSEKDDESDSDEHAEGTGGLLDLCASQPMFKFPSPTKKSNDCVELHGGTSLRQTWESSIRFCT